MRRRSGGSSSGGVWGSSSAAWHAATRDGIRGATRDVSCVELGPSNAAAVAGLAVDAVAGGETRARIGARQAHAASIAAALPCKSCPLTTPPGPETSGRPIFAVTQSKNRLDPVLLVGTPPLAAAAAAATAETSEAVAAGGGSSSASLLMTAAAAVPSTAGAAARHAGTWSLMSCTRAPCTRRKRPPAMSPGPARLWHAAPTLRRAATRRLGGAAGDVAFCRCAISCCCCCWGCDASGVRVVLSSDGDGEG
mmetsp:Transcript_24400/g.60718  ORF Transcript_24400/g.60718 Transcript_24400/m.60718 type:complete len:251 (-) Transcript_24400:559-1311(-)